MLNRLRDALAQAYMRSPLAPHKRWAAHMQRHYPILKGVFPNSAYGRLCTLRVLDALEDGNLPLARKHVIALQQLCREGTDAEKALWEVLAGLYENQTGNTLEMARRLRWAGRFGHDYHMPHAMLCTHYLFERRLFDRAFDEAEQAIDCIYKYPPITEQKQWVIALLYADQALSAVMMHRPQDAARLLKKAEVARNSGNYLLASAVLDALLGHRETAEKALAALKDTDPGRYGYAAANVPLMLAGTHPHFAAKTPDLDAIRTYWAQFLLNEDELLRLLDTEGHSAAFALHHTFFAPLDTEPPELDMIALGFKRAEDGTLLFTLQACYSRTYGALIDAMISACPEEVKGRWRFIRDD